MSTVISLYQIPQHIKTLDDVPANFALRPLGSNGEVIAILNEFFPTNDFPAPDWVDVASDEVSGVYVVDADPVFDVMLRDPSPAFINRICQRTGWSAFDPLNGSIIASA